MISSPVSRMTMAARSYLTIVLVLMLVLVAMHFSIQAWGQQEARQWISTWETKYGGHVGGMRLRILRGALTLRDIRWESEGVHFDAPFVLLRGNSFSSISQVEVREIVLKGAKTTVSNDLFQKLVQKKMSLSDLLPWASLFDDVRDVHGSDMAIVVQAGSGGLPLQTTAFSHVKFFSVMEGHQWSLSGDVWGGHVSLSSQNYKQDLMWLNLDAADVTASLGLAGLKGRVHGKSHWQEGQLSGDIAWQDKLSNGHKNDILEGNLTFQGAMDKSGWQGNIQAVDWPLQIFSAYTPVLHARKLTSAYLTGPLHLKITKQGWQANMTEGSMRQLNYRSNSKGAWHLQRVGFQQAKLVWPQRLLHIKSIAIEQGSWAVDSLSTSTAVKSASFPTWKVDLPAVSFKAVKFGDVAKNIWLSEVQGKLSLHGQRLMMKANSSSKAMGEWKLQAQGFIQQNQSDAGVNLAIKVQAEHVPLFHFRDALPQILVKEARLNGDVSLDLKGVWNKAGWQLQGDMRGQDIMWNRGAWLWRAEHMQLDNIVFSSTKMPHVGAWQIHNWLGQTSLRPWSQVGNVDAAQQAALPLSLDGWQIKHINIGYGKFSLGQEDAVWFESDMVKLGAIAENQVVNMDMQGQLADGDFVFKGEWFPWGRTPWISLHASLKQALPFAVAPWFKLSGLPMLTRGRISADINIRQKNMQQHQYQGQVQLHLNNGQLQDGVSSNQILSKATGYEAHGLFDRINSHGDIDLKIPLQGNWVYTPLNSSVLGQGLLSALADKAALEVKPLPKRVTFHLSNIRLHDSFGGSVDSLKHNERVRLRKVLHVLQREKEWEIELRPQLGKERLNEQLIKRVRNTQQQIEAFLVARGVKASRIFPVWPEEGNRQGESTGILIQAVK